MRLFICNEEEEEEEFLKVYVCIFFQNIVLMIVVNDVEMSYCNSRFSNT